MGTKTSGVAGRIYPGELEGLEAIKAAPPAVDAELVLRAVSGYATGALTIPERRLAAFYKLGEAYRLWGARSEGVKQAKAPAKAAFEVAETPTDT